MWSGTLGHSKQIEQLSRALKEGKLAHAILFSGIDGIGKKRVALGLAKSLNGKIADRFHPDCHEIAPTGQTIKVDVIRELKQKIYFHPLEGRAKVVIIDNADAMTEAAANALLKILEEPPSVTYFILISSKPAKLLPTIRSRCQKLEFSPLNEETLTQKLIQDGVDKKEATLRAKISGGSLKAAIELDIPLFEKIESQMEALSLTAKPSQIFSLSEAWMEEDEKIPSILNILHHLWHQKILETRDVGAEQKQLNQWQAIQNASRGLEAYANKQLLLENLLFTLAQ